jgi:hypothetical protein
MNSLWVVVIGVVVIYLAYNFYARRIDRVVIASDPKRATPATMYMDGADFMPTSRFVLYGYHFKSIAAAGPIVGVITAANLWGWLPSIIWLMVGVTFIGWASDYTAIMMSVRNDGNSLSAIAHRLISPRTRTILFVFIFFYLLLIGGAFVGIMAAILDARPDVPFGIVVLAVMGVLGGWLIYRRRADLIMVTLLIVVVTLAAMALGPLGVKFSPNNQPPPTWKSGVVSGPVLSINNALNGGRGSHHLRPAHSATWSRWQATGDQGLRPRDQDHQCLPVIPVLVPVPAGLRLPWHQPGDLALRPAGELHRLLGHGAHHRIERHRCHPGAVHQSQCGDLPGCRVQGIRTDPDDRSHPGAVADAVRDHRVWRDQRLACPLRLGRHRAPARVRDRCAAGRRWWHVQ